MSAQCQLGAFAGQMRCPWVALVEAPGRFIQQAVLNERKSGEFRKAGAKNLEFDGTGAKHAIVSGAHCAFSRQRRAPPAGRQSGALTSGHSCAALLRAARPFATAAGAALFCQLVSLHPPSSATTAPTALPRAFPFGSPFSPTSSAPARVCASPRLACPRHLRTASRCSPR